MTIQMNFNYLQLKLLKSSTSIDYRFISNLKNYIHHKEQQQLSGVTHKKCIARALHRKWHQEVSRIYKGMGTWIQFNELTFFTLLVWNGKWKTFSQARTEFFLGKLFRTRNIKHGMKSLLWKIIFVEYLIDNLNYSFEVFN